MNDNMTFWNNNKKTDPKRVKAITGKQYKGNSPQPYYLVERMTEAFGMCGIGWGLNILNERMERLTDTDVLHVAVVELWYKHGDKNGSITQIGQTKAAYKTNAGSMMIDEDAPKKSITDAMTKCMSYLGFAGDIFSGQWDDSKYVASLEAEFSEKPASAKSVSRDVWDGLSVEEQNFLTNIAIEMVSSIDDGNMIEANRLFYGNNLNADEQTALWSRLDSKQRSAIKAYRNSLAKAA
jgi:hypothetical protein